MSDNIVRRSLIKETTRNIENIAKQLDEGAQAEKTLITELITAMVEFVDKTVKTVRYDYTACAQCEHSYVNEDNLPLCKQHDKPLRELTPVECKELQIVEP